MRVDERDAVFMTSALDEARASASAGEVPVGAVVVFGDTIVSRSGNRMRRDHEATAHAESIAIRAAYLTLGRPRLEGCTLYVTLEPCAMCAGAIILARFDRIVFGAWDEKAGMAGSVGAAPRSRVASAPTSAAHCSRHFSRRVVSRARTG
jgi:tRNA(adenine34) deaminase